MQTGERILLDKNTKYEIKRGGPSMAPYVLITPAKNEAAFIRETLEAVVGQTMCPSQWIIVDDGSTDETATIVKTYAERYPFITLLQLGETRRRDFSNKVAAFNAGQRLLKGSGYSFIGNLDADIRVERTYFETVLSAFEHDEHLGIAGGKVFTTINERFICRDNTIDSVGGAVQLFRRECFEEIGGYRALPYGGIDAAAEIIARSRGWHVQKVPLSVFEQRQTGSAQHSIWRGRYRDGIKFHTLGYGGLFFACKCIFRCADTPKVIGSTLSMVGFIFARLRKLPICMPMEAVVYLRSEQTKKLWTWLYRPFAKLYGKTAGVDTSSSEILETKSITAAKE